MAQDEIPDVETGVNPKEYFSKKAWEQKGFISANSSINFAVIKCIQDTDFEKQDVLAECIKLLTEFSGSIKGQKNILYGQVANYRIQADDQKETVQIEGKK